MGFFKSAIKKGVENTGKGLKAVGTTIGDKLIEVENKRNDRKKAYKEAYDKQKLKNSRIAGREAAKRGGVFNRLNANVGRAKDLNTGEANNHLFGGGNNTASDFYFGSSNQTKKKSIREGWF